MRYAIYYAPTPGTGLHRRGSAWLGRDAHTGELLAQPDLEGLSRLAADARRYGFHATLKAPFQLREGIPPEALMRACAALAADATAFHVKLEAALMDGFVALVPAADPGRLHDLAARCVRELDDFRSPPAEQELARRRKVPLTGRQDANLLRWGYPYVLEDFRFHITLTGRLEPGESESILRAAQAWFHDEIAGQIMIDGLTLFHEPKPGAPFLALRHFPFPISTAEAAA
jgi:putative phosphonate metabolism protein